LSIIWNRCTNTIIGGCFNNFAGTTSDCQNPCFPGKFCPPGSSLPLDCPAGNYCPRGYLSNPVPCPPGKYNQLPNSIYDFDCIQSSPGTYCNSNISATGFLPCPAGNFCPAGSFDFGEPCPTGNYCPFATTQLLKCPKGSYCPISSSTPTLCPSGSYCPANSGNFISCQGGYQCPSGTFEPILCLKNTFALPQSGICTPCPSGQFTKGEGANSCIVCPTSKWNAEGWYCMSEIEKGIFIVGWIVTSFSAMLTLWKFYTFTKERLKKIANNGLKRTLRNFVFMEKILKKIKLNEMIVSQSEEEPMIAKNEIKKLYELINSLQTQIDDMKNK